MKIQKVKINKFKVLENIEQEVAGKNILLIGENGVGKSSFIQFIDIALGNSKNIPPDTDGNGSVIVDKNGKQFTLKVKIKDGKSVVEIITEEGIKDTRKGTLAGIVGAVEFDIDEFVELSKTSAGRKKQVEIFKSFLPEEIRSELEKYETQIKSYYDDRTFTNRSIKELEGAIKTNPLYGVPFKKTNVDVSELTTKLENANKHNNQITQVTTRQETRIKEIEAAEKELVELADKMQKIKDGRDVLLSQRDQADKFLKETKEIPTEEIQKQINEAGKINEEVNSWKLLKEQETKLEKLQDSAGNETVMIDTCKQAIIDTVQQMESPVEGLGYDNESLMYNGIPVNPDSLSTSEIMELGCKLKMAENKDLGILYLQRTESIGAKRWKEILEMCEKAGWQLIAEKVERGKEKLTIELFS